MSNSLVGFSYGILPGLRTYYFRKLAKYIGSQEYRLVKAVRERTAPQITVPELLFLRWGIKRCRPEVVAEIGSYCGASTSLLADAIQRRGKGRVYAIDLFSKSGGSYGGEYWKTFDRIMQPYTEWFEKIEGDSKAVPWNTPIDFLFIDGDHAESGALADIAKYTPFVKPGGFVFMHDYVNHPETNSMVKSAVDRTLMNNQNYRCLGVVTSLIGFQKTKSSGEN